MFVCILGYSTSIPFNYCVQRTIGKFCRKHFEEPISSSCFSALFNEKQLCHNGKCIDLSKCIEGKYLKARKHTKHI